MHTNGDNSFGLKVGLARMLCGGVILDVTSAAQARIAEEAGATAVMALERVPAEIRREGGVARMAAIERIREIQAAVTIPVMAKVRIGHTAEAQILEALSVDFVDESEVLTPADGELHVDKHRFRVPFVCGARSLGEALRRISEGAALIRTKGEAGTGDVSEAVRHLRLIQRELRELLGASEEELALRARELGAPHELVRRVWSERVLPVPNFAAGGVATPADAALVMSLGAEAVFVGSGVFLSPDPARTAAAIVKATARYRDPAVLLEAAEESGGAMKGIARAALPESELLQVRGW
jgi:pyridoxal 5'-phosphate synthase pdxS subunit